MSYDAFCRRVTDVAKRTGANVRFFLQDGKYIAKCTGGITFTGNSVSRRVFVKWGSGHSAIMD